jgi:chromosome segregation ATPase
MTFDRRDIEEVGVAVEALGIMLEKQMGLLHQRLAELYRLLAESREENKNPLERIKKMGEDITKTQKSFEHFENVLSRTDSRLVDLQKDLTDEEDLTQEIKNDLLIIKRDLQMLRSDMKELLKRQGGERKNEDSGEGERGWEDSTRQDLT